MSRVEVRLATRDDVPLIVQFIKDLAEYEREPQAAEATPAMIDEALFAGRPACECLIGLVDGRPEGFALFFHNFSTWKGRRGVYLEDLFVRPSARGVGLGKALLARLAQIALDRGCPRLEWNVLDWNEPALKFYRSLGAEPLAGWTIHRLSGDALARLAAHVKP
ncbi:MAG: GNAT family N-acetyltransferase [Tepidisphaera sp.]|nr:GNAT family N-acetyltransferase [Tepidisphaera sp.]